VSAGPPSGTGTTGEPSEPSEPSRAPTSPARIRALLDAHGLRPSRALGQNFLADANIAAKIVRLAGVQAGDEVVEVGPGVGALTLALADAGAAVTCVELDRRLVPLLEDVVAGRGVRVVVADALAADWAALAPEPGTVMVSNLPYNVATSVVLTVLEQAPTIRRLLVMVQREAGERLAARAGDPAYGAVSVKVAYDAAAEVVGRVPPTVFVPRPKVDSALVRLDRHATPSVDVARAPLFRIVEAGFATRRKTLRNALRPLLGDPAVVEAVLAAAGVDASARAEELDLPQWAALARAATTDPGGSR
jgi:16S rRNA (adenine1518-N6/adenine1519-N6)-dimethyltransferase